MNKKYELAVQYMHPKEGRVIVTVSVVYAQFPSIPVCSLDVSIDRDEKFGITFYETEALKKTADIISGIADDLKEAV